MADWHALNGGVQRQTGEIGGMIDFGWIGSDPADLQDTVTTPDGTRALFVAVDPNEDVPSVTGDQVLLWLWARAACAKVPAGYPVFNGLPLLSWQFTGSCVNSGGFNAFTMRELIELLISGEAYAPTVPFTLFTYGQSRFLAFRDSGEGEGSSGDAMARAFAQLGAPAVGTPETPSPVFCGPAICYSRADELHWSSVRNHPDSVKGAASTHTITYGVVKSCDDAEAELRRLRPLTWAGDWGGEMSGVVRGTPPVLMMRRREQWGHQQSCIGFMRHPELGRIWRIQNNWFRAGSDMQVEYTRTREGQAISRIVTPGVAIPMHGENPDAGFNGPPGGYWVTDADMEYQARTGEVRSIRSVRGYSGVVNLAGF